MNSIITVSKGDISSYREEETQERSSESQQQMEELPRKPKEKFEETAKPTGNAPKQTFQGSSEPNKTGGLTQVYISAIQIKSNNPSFFSLCF